MDKQASGSLMVRIERQLESMTARDKRLMGLMVLVTLVFLGGTTSRAAR